MHLCYVKLSQKRPDFEKLSRRACAGTQTLYSPLINSKFLFCCRYGFSPDGEGTVQFVQHIKQLEREDPEIERLYTMVKAYFIPPMNSASLNGH